MSHHFNGCVRTWYKQHDWVDPFSLVSTGVGGVFLAHNLSMGTLKLSHSLPKSWCRSSPSSCDRSSFVGGLWLEWSPRPPALKSGQASFDYCIHDHPMSVCATQKGQDEETGLILQSWISSFLANLNVVKTAKPVQMPQLNPSIWRWPGRLRTITEIRQATFWFCFFVEFMPQFAFISF